MGDSNNGPTEIAIDFASLERSSRDLVLAATDLGSATSTAQGARISATSFGAMNMPLAIPVAAVSQHTTALLGAAAQLTELLGAAVTDAASDWQEYESSTASVLDRAGADLEASRDLG